MATMARDKWREVRNDLNAVARELAAADEGASAREIVAAFRKQRLALIRDATDTLIDSALTRLVGDVVKLRADDDIDVSQPDFFERTIGRLIAVPKSSSGAGRRNRYRVIGRLPVLFAEQMFKHDLERRRHKRDHIDVYKEIIDFVRQHGATDDMTLDEALAAARKASATKAKASGKKP
jgi:hypothetical protein